VIVGHGIDPPAAVVDSAIRENRLRRMGADHFIDYMKENFAAIECPEVDR